MVENTIFEAKTTILAICNYVPVASDFCISGIKYLGQYVFECSEIKMWNKIV